MATERRPANEPQGAAQSIFGMFDEIRGRFPGKGRDLRLAEQAARTKQMKDIESGAAADMQQINQMIQWAQSLPPYTAGPDGNLVPNPTRAIADQFLMEKFGMGGPGPGTGGGGGGSQPNPQDGLNAFREERTPNEGVGRDTWSEFLKNIGGMFTGGQKQQTGSVTQPSTAQPSEAQLGPTGLIPTVARAATKDARYDMPPADLGGFWNQVQQGVSGAYDALWSGKQPLPGSAFQSQGAAPSQGPTFGPPMSAKQEPGRDLERQYLLQKQFMEAKAAHAARQAQTQPQVPNVPAKGAGRGGRSGWGDFIKNVPPAPQMPQMDPALMQALTGPVGGGAMPGAPDSSITVDQIIEMVRQLSAR